MKTEISKTGLKLLVIYLVLVFLSTIFLITTGKKSALSGIYLVHLTIPWSYILAIIMVLNENMYDLSSFSLTVMDSVFVIANSIIIYILGSKHDKSKKRTP